MSSFIKNVLTEPGNQVGEVDVSHSIHSSFYAKMKSNLLFLCPEDVLKFAFKISTTTQFDSIVLHRVLRKISGFRGSYAKRSNNVCERNKMATRILMGNLKRESRHLVQIFLHTPKTMLDLVLLFWLRETNLISFRHLASSLSFFLLIFHLVVCSRAFTNQ